VGIGFADFGVRLGGPVVLALLGFAAAGGDSGNGEVTNGVLGAVVGFFLGYAGSIALDAAVFAREKVARERSGYNFQMLPIRDIDGRMKLTGAGLSGQF
jgi:hypothetical protein